MAISQQRLLHGEGKDWVSAPPWLLAPVICWEVEPALPLLPASEPRLGQQTSCHLTTFNTSHKIVGVLCLDSKAGPALMLAARRANEKSPTRGSSPLPGPSREGQSGREGATSSPAQGDMVSKTWPPPENGTGGRGHWGKVDLLKNQ